MAQRVQCGRRQREARRLCSLVGWWRREALWPCPRDGKQAIHGKVELDSKAGADRSARARESVGDKTQILAAGAV